jgi:hypothetical protein
MAWMRLVLELHRLGTPISMVQKRQIKKREAQCEAETCHCLQLFAKDSRHARLMPLGNERLFDLPMAVRREL